MKSNVLVLLLLFFNAHGMKLASAPAAAASPSTVAAPATLTTPVLEFILAGQTTKLSHVAISPGGEYALTLL